MWWGDRIECMLCDDVRSVARVGAAGAGQAVLHVSGYRTRVFPECDT